MKTVKPSFFFQVIILSQKRFRGMKINQFLIIGPIDGKEQATLHKAAERKI